MADIVFNMRMAKHQFLLLTLPKEVGPVLINGVKATQSEPFTQLGQAGLR